ncbi:Doublecortin domain-containing protein 2 [Collichthys lucidus]|uniref:Doublecortin domain-containing protein 2 n=1 Tax=Collichthys lucidus TaxID=240159 RepID=A0A4U5V3L5_COLLU|nr:Doublecortin domain-containing protein 2 [Collichthys lucidus]
MSSEKPNFLSQPVVKNIFMFRNGDPYYEARRIVINQKRVSNFETLLREVTGGIQAPFGAVRNIYTPRGGHKVDCLDSLQSGEQYVAAGRERFKRLDYQLIGMRRKRMLQTLPMQAKPLPPNRIIVSARFLKPIKEPCTIFVVANGDVLNPAMRLLIHQRMLGQFERILEMITEKMGMKVLGGVRSLYTYEGQQVSDGNQLESGQLYVAVGRERFKKLAYSDLLFTKPRGTRRVNGMKAYSLPPIYRFSKQNGNSKSVVRSSDSGDGDSKASPPVHNGNNNKEHLSSIVREISQARLMTLRKKRSGQSMTISDNDDPESKADDGNTEDKPPQDQPAEEKPADDDNTKAAEENDEKASEKVEENEEPAAENTKEEDESMDKEEVREDKQETNDEKEGEATTELEEKKEKEEEEEKVEAEVEEEVTDECKEEVKSEEQGSSSSNSDKNQGSKEKEDEGHTSSEGEKNEQDKNKDKEKRDKDSREGEKDSEVNDVDKREEEKEAENSKDPGKSESDNETKENDGSRSNSRNSNHREDGSRTQEEATKESEEEENRVNGEVSGEADEVKSEAELATEDKNSASNKVATANGEKAEGDDKGNQDKSKKEKA